MSDDGVIDLDEYRKRIRESVHIPDEDAMLTCPTCDDTMFWLVPVDQALALICQHCNEAVGYGFQFDDEDEEG